MASEFPLLLAPPDPSTPTVASDLEGTLTNGVTVRAIHNYLSNNGGLQATRAIYRRRMPTYILRKIFRLDVRMIKNEWMRDLFRAFKGMSRMQIRQMTDWVTAESIWAERRRPVIQELEAHLTLGRRVIIVSGMPYPILESLMAHLPGMEAIGTAVVPDGPLFSGELEKEVNVGRRKVERLRPFSGEDGRIYAAYGDTFSDLPMLEMSINPAAVFPDRRLRQVAQSHGWRVIED